MLSITLLGLLARVLLRLVRLMRVTQVALSSVQGLRIIGVYDVAFAVLDGGIGIDFLRIHFHTGLSPPVVVMITT